MAYTPELKELIKKVEATRPERVAMALRNEHYPVLSLEERERVLNKYHPDYQKEARRNQGRSQQGRYFSEQGRRPFGSKSYCQAGRS